MQRRDNPRTACPPRRSGEPQLLRVTASLARGPADAARAAVAATAARIVHCPVVLSRTVKRKRPSAVVRAVPTLTHRPFRRRCTWRRDRRSAGVVRPRQTRRGPRDTASRRAPVGTVLRPDRAAVAQPRLSVRSGACGGAGSGRRRRWRRGGALEGERCPHRRVGVDRRPPRTGRRVRARRDRPRVAWMTPSDLGGGEVRAEVPHEPGEPGDHRRRHRGSAEEKHLVTRRPQGSRAPACPRWRGSCPGRGDVNVGARWSRSSRSCRSAPMEPDGERPPAGRRRVQGDPGLALPCGVPGRARRAARSATPRRPPPIGERRVIDPAAERHVHHRAPAFVAHGMPSTTLATKVALPAASSCTVSVTFDAISGLS